MTMKKVCSGSRAVFFFAVLCLAGGCALNTEKIEARIPTCGPDTTDCVAVRKTEVHGARGGVSADVTQCTFYGKMAGVTVTFNECEMTGAEE